MAKAPVPQRSRSRPGSRCAKGRSALRSPALPLDMPHLGRSRWTYAHCAHRHGPGLDMPARWPRGSGWTCPTFAAAAGHMPIVLIGTGSDWTCPPVGHGAPAGHAPPSPQPLDICPLCSSPRARTGHVQRLARRALLQFPRCRRVDPGNWPLGVPRPVHRSVEEPDAAPRREPEGGRGIILKRQLGVRMPPGRNV